MTAPDPDLPEEGRVTKGREEGEVRIRMVKKLPFDCLAARPFAIRRFADLPLEVAHRQQWPRNGLSR